MTKYSIQYTCGCKREVSEGQTPSETCEKHGKQIKITENIKKVRIKVTYKSKTGLNEKADEKIRMIIDHIGAVWYASGFDLTNGERDICFDLKL